jgi:predicted small secreted protein
MRRAQIFSGNFFQINQVITREQRLPSCIEPPTFATAREGFGKEDSLMIKRIVAIALLGTTIMVAACNTVEGAGKDVSSAGKAVANAADGAK